MELTNTYLPNDSKEMSKEALRAALRIELQNKKQCAYHTYKCTQLTLDGYKFCAKHILNDKNAPFKQCNFTYAANGKRCHLPTLKAEKKDFSYCADHALKATLNKNRQNCKFPPPQTAEVLLHSLSHYVKKPRVRTNSQQSEDERIIPDEGVDIKTTKSLDPFTELGTCSNQAGFASSSNTLDFCSDSESDIEPSMQCNIWHDAQNESSDNESIDSDQEDILKHANVYTAEETTSIAKDKLMRLQTLYIEEYRYLQHLLKEKRRKYLHSLKREKETCCNIYNQVRDNPKEQRLYKKLKAYTRYHTNRGMEAILSKKLHDLRAKITEGMVPKSQSSSKCTFTEGGVKCGEKTIPLARHCRKHILEDPNQVLFRSCGRVRADVECNTAVEAIFDDATCRLHSDIPHIRTYNQIRKDSESSEFDDHSSGGEHMTMPSLTPNEFFSAHSISQATMKTEQTLNDDYIMESIPKLETPPTMLFEESDNNSEPMKDEASFSFRSEGNDGIDRTKSEIESDSLGAALDRHHAEDAKSQRDSSFLMIPNNDEDYAINMSGSSYSDAGKMACDNKLLTDDRNNTFVDCDLESTEKTAAINDSQGLFELTEEKMDQD